MAVLDTYSHLTPESQDYDGWYVINEVDFMSSDSSIRTALSCRSDDMYDCDAETPDGLSTIPELTDNADLAKIVAEKIDQINKETSDDIRKIKDKLEKIEFRWDGENLKRYTENRNGPPELNRIDELLGQAIREASEIHKGANAAVQELSKSVENVDDLYSKTIELKDYTSKFRRTASNELSAQPLPLKTQLFAIALSVITIKFLITLLS